MIQELSLLHSQLGKAFGHFQNFQLNKQKIADRQSSLSYEEASFMQSAQISEYEGAYSREMSIAKSKNLSRNFLRQQGAFRTRMAISGVTMGEGSSLEVLMDQADEHSLQQGQIAYEGDMAGWRSDVQAQQYRARASFRQWQAEAAKPSLFEQTGMILQTGMDIWGTFIK